MGTLLLRIHDAYFIESVLVSALQTIAERVAPKMEELVGAG